MIKHSISILVTSLSILALSSYKPIIYRVYFRAKLVPGYVSKEKIEKFYLKYASSNENLAFLPDSSFVEKINEPGWAFNSWELYNGNGFRVKRANDSLSCIGSDYDFLANFNLDRATLDSTNILEASSFNDLIEYPQKEESEKIKISNSKCDYTLLLYWSTWRGRFSQDILNMEKVFVQNNPDLRIRVIKINMDFREEMENTWIDKTQLFIDESRRKRIE